MPIRKSGTKKAVNTPRNTPEVKGKIFISYRREDSIDVTGRIYDRLEQAIPAEDIFMDVDSIPPGVDFRVHIDRAIAESALMLVVIGRNWATARDSAGFRRLDDPGDFVRLEIEAAMRCELPIIPLLVHNAAMPAADSLPAPLAPLVYRNAIPVRSGADFRRDMERVLKAVELYRPVGRERVEGAPSPGHTQDIAGRASMQADPPSRRSRPSKVLQEGEFLEAFADPGYRAAVEALLESCRRLGLKLKFGAAGVSVQIAVRDRARPLSVARLYPPGKSGGVGLEGVILGFDPDRVEEAPSMHDAFDAYLGVLTALDGTHPSPAPVMRGRLFPPEALARHREPIVHALEELVKSSRTH